MAVMSQLLWSISLWLVSALQLLVHSVFPPASAIMAKVVCWLEMRRQAEAARQLKMAQKTQADQAAGTFVRKSGYSQLQNRGDIGSRSGRHWYTVVGGDGQEYLLTVTLVSPSCPLNLSQQLQDLNTLLQNIQHPLLQDIEEVYYSSLTGHVITVQPLKKTGSLKDLIHKTRPIERWSIKYNKYGRSIVEATSGVLRTIGGLNRLQSPLLHDIREVKYFPDTAEMQVLIVEPEEKSPASLRELVQLRSPTKRKNGKSHLLSALISTEQVASYGRQILEAMVFLYDVGLPEPLGHVQTGNIFIEGDICRLGGFENRLLGYRTCLYGDQAEDIDDVIMFGHVIFEMSCGYALSGLLPTEQDYRSVQDKRVLDVLQVIFEQDQNRMVAIAAIRKILEHHFFSTAHTPSSLDTTVSTAAVPAVRELLSPLLTALGGGGGGQRKKPGQLDNEGQGRCVIA